jgi:hypothetical protein
MTKCCISDAVDVKGMRGMLAVTVMKLGMVKTGKLINKS